MAAPTAIQIQHFLVTRNGQQMRTLLQSIQDPEAQKGLTSFMLLHPPPTEGRTTTPGKLKKALNSYMAFRCEFSIHYIL
jgi:hypothetical protein